jgi:segregation and condensation protein A
MNTAPDTAEKYLKDVTLFDLLVAFQKAVADMPKITKHVVEKHDITIEEQEQFIRLQLRQKPSRTFMQLLKGVKQRIVAVVTLLAILEMVRNGEIRIRQKSVFGQVQMELAGGK